jgi:hypothetical protein
MKKYIRLLLITTVLNACGQNDSSEQESSNLENNQTSFGAGIRVFRSEPSLSQRFLEEKIDAATEHLDKNIDAVIAEVIKSTGEVSPPIMPDSSSSSKMLPLTLEPPKNHNQEILTQAINKIRDTLQKANQARESKSYNDFREAVDVYKAAHTNFAGISSETALVGGGESLVDQLGTLQEQYPTNFFDGWTKELDKHLSEVYKKEKDGSYPFLSTMLTAITAKFEKNYEGEYAETDDMQSVAEFIERDIVSSSETSSIKGKIKAGDLDGIVRQLSPLMVEKISILLVAAPEEYGKEPYSLKEIKAILAAPVGTKGGNKNVEGLGGRAYPYFNTYATAWADGKSLNIEDVVELELYFEVTSKEVIKEFLLNDAVTKVFFRNIQPLLSSSVGLVSDSKIDDVAKAILVELKTAGALEGISDDVALKAIKEVLRKDSNLFATQSTLTQLKNIIVKSPHDLSSNVSLRQARINATGSANLAGFKMNGVAGQSVDLGLPLFVQLKGDVSSAKATEATTGSVAYRLGNTVIGAIQGYANSGAGFGTDSRQLETSVVVSQSFGSFFIEGQIGSVSATDVHLSDWSGLRSQVTLGLDTTFVSPFVQLTHRQLDRSGVFDLSETTAYVGLDMDIAKLAADTYSIDTRLLAKAGYGSKHWVGGSKDFGSTTGFTGSVEWSASLNLNSGVAFSSNLALDTTTGSSAGLTVSLDH